MALSQLVDLVKITITSTGTGVLTLGAAIPGYRGVEALTDGQTYSYSIQQNGNYEVGQGTYLAAGTQFVRTPEYSSNGGATIDLATGAALVFTARAEDFAIPGPPGPDTSAYLAQMAADVSAVQTLATQCAANANSTDADALATASDRVQAGNSSTSAAVSAGGASAAAAIKNILASSVSAGGTLPFEVTGISGGIGTGSGGTAGTYNGGVSGGPPGFQWSYTIDGTGKLASYTIINPGISTSNTAPTLSIPSGAAGGNIAGATAPTATVGTIPSNRYFYAPSGDGSKLLAWGNNAGTLASAPFGGTQVGIATASSALAGTAVPGTALAITDGYAGNASFYIDNNGQAVAKVLSTSVLNGMNMTEIQRRIARTISVPADYIGVINYGQSKALGQAAGVGSYPGSFFNHLMFNANGSSTAGPRAQEGTGTAAQNHASLIPFYEVLNGSTGNGESGLGNFFRMIEYLLVNENGLSSAAAGFTFIGSAPGQSNTTIANLSKGTTPYQHVLDDVTYGYSLALAAGKTYNVPVILWAQGEADITAGTSRSTYSTALQTLQTNLDADIRAITGQANTVKLLCYQVDQYNQTNANIGLAQTDAAAANSNIIISHPDYAVPHIPGNTHYYEEGYAINGAYFAAAYKRLVFDGLSSYQGLVVDPNHAIQRTGSILSVPFLVPVAPLILDTYVFPSQTNYGFDALDHTGAANAIVSVTALYNRLRIVLTTADSGTLRYCSGTTWGGNLRDSQTIDAQAFQRRQLTNACLAFEKTFN